MTMLRADGSWQVMRMSRISFRIDKKYRALFICLPEDKVEVVAVTKHYRK
jgi:hypothetical protein